MKVNAETIDIAKKLCALATHFLLNLFDADLQQLEMVIEMSTCSHGRHT